MHYFAIHLSHNAIPEILVRDMLLSGVISNDWQYYDRNERESSMNNQHQVLSLGTRRYRVSLLQLCLY